MDSFLNFFKKKKKCVGVFVAFHEADTSKQKWYKINFNQMIQRSLKFVSTSFTEFRFKIH